jgi:ring-1,2-phenylacetyl-CoA epoxidase subunit PaaE
MSRFYKLAVADIRPETRDTISIAFEVAEELRELFMNFRAGQHLALRVRLEGEELVRTYSICCAPQEQELRVAVKAQPYGRFSTYANTRLKVGDIVEVMPPAGHFSVPFDPAHRKHYLAFAAGSGITPIIALAKTALQTEPDSRVTLVYGNRSTQSMIFREQLEDLKNSYLGRFNLVPVMSREQTDIELFHGRIDQAKCRALFERWVNINSVDECFICGPEEMMREVTQALAAHGVDQSRIHFELFTTPGEVKQRQAQRQREAVGRDRTVSQITVRIDGQQVDFELAQNEASILEGGLAVGLELPFSCKGGVCSTCRAKVVVGEVEMDVNYALEDYEVEAGYVLTCQSYPLTERVVLDYDE